MRLLYPFKNLIETITTDNGIEFSEHRYIAKKLKTTVCFADPYASWQKGGNRKCEQTNKTIYTKRYGFQTFEKRTSKAISVQTEQKTKRKDNV